MSGLDKYITKTMPNACEWIYHSFLYMYQSCGYNQIIYKVMYDLNLDNHVFKLAPANFL